MTFLPTAHLTFRKATASGGNNTGPNCVEIAEWTTPSLSNGNGGNNCVEVTFAKAQLSNPSGNCVEVGPARKATASGSAGHCVTTSQAVKATASAAQYNCVTVAHAKATASPNDSMGGCVEPGQAQPSTAHTDCTPETCQTPGIEPGDIVVRDSKSGENSELIVFKRDQWDRFTERVIAGEYELTDGDYPYIMRDPNGGPVTLHFNKGEWDAFRDGCTKGEFNYPAPELTNA